MTIQCSKQCAAHCSSNYVLHVSDYDRIAFLQWTSQWNHLIGTDNATCIVATADDDDDEDDDDDDNGDDDVDNKCNEDNISCCGVIWC